VRLDEPVEAEDRHEVVAARTNNGLWLAGEDHCSRFRTDIKTAVQMELSGSFIVLEEAKCRRRER